MCAVCCSWKGQNNRRRCRTTDCSLAQGVSTEVRLMERGQQQSVAEVGRHGTHGAGWKRTLWGRKGGDRAGGLAER
eukprot:1332037-Pleurochrysis_carterae.AAC.1